MRISDLLRLELLVYHDTEKLMVLFSLFAADIKHVLAQLFFTSNLQYRPLSLININYLLNLSADDQRLVWFGYGEFEEKGINSISLGLGV